MELRRDIPLMDKVTIYGIRVVDIDNVSDLQSKGIITIKENSPTLITSSGEYYSSINIEKDGNLDVFRYGVTVNSTIFGIVELSVPDTGYGNLNCLTASEYREQLLQVKERLKSKYGILIDISEARYKVIEINKTIVLNHDFHEYRRPFKLMMNLLPDKLRLKKESEWKSKINDQRERKYIEVVDMYFRSTKGSSSKQKGLSIKLYNKTNQMKMVHNITLNQNYMRYEITILDAERIKSCLGTNKVSEITDSIINKFFYDFIDNNIESKYIEWKEQENKILKKLIRKHYKDESKNWIRNLIDEISNNEHKNGGIPEVLDICDIVDAISDMKFSNKDKKKRAKKSVMRICKNNMDYLNNEDTAKMEEVIQKLKNLDT